MNGQLAAKHREAMHIPTISMLDLLKSVLILILTTLMGFLFYNWGFTEANIITLYILGVMLISVFTKSSVCSFIASIVSVLTFNFFFTDPRFSLHAYDSGYPVTFLVMFLASLLTGSLASRLKSHAKRSAQVAWRTKLLFETSQSLQKAETQEEIISITAKQLLKIFQRDIITYLLGQDSQINQRQPVRSQRFFARIQSVQKAQLSTSCRNYQLWHCRGRLSKGKDGDK